MAQLSMEDQHKVDELTDKIRLLTKESKEVLRERIKLESEKNRLFLSLDEWMILGACGRGNELFLLYSNLPSSCLMCLDRVGRINARNWYLVMVSHRARNTAYQEKNIIPPITPRHT